MVEITQCNWDDLDIITIATLTGAVYKFEGLGDPSLEQIKRHLISLNERFPFEAVFIATHDGTIVGWTGVERQTENIGEIGRWHPYVVDAPDRNEIAKSLISEVIKYAKRNGMNRLEISFGDISDETIKTYNERISWLESLDWSLVEDTLFMNKNALEKIPKADIPDGYRLQPLLENNDEALYKCHYAAFTTSMAREFNGLSEEEKKQHFNKLYDRTQPINAEASYVLKKDEEIACILLVITRENEEYISIVAVHPSYRGYGLAKALLATGIQKVREQGATDISIGVDEVNTPAVQLYRKFGFEVRSRLAFHSWSVVNTLNR